MTQQTVSEGKTYPLSFYLLSVLIGLMMVLLFLELLFRVLPVYLYQQWDVDETNPVLRYQPDTEFSWSKGWDFALVSRKRSNNDGFLSDAEYEQSNASPLMVAIGDSYVEAMQVSNENTFHGILHKQLNGQGRFYGLGFSGSPLTNYLAYARFAYKHYKPDAEVFVIVGNDFDESLCRYHNQHEGMYCFEENNKGQLDLVLDDFQPGFLRSAARRSALMRYVFLTAGFDWRSLVGARKETPDQYVGNVSSKADDEKIELSKRAVDRFFELLPKETNLATDRISFVVDGMRPQLYTSEGQEAAKGSFFDLMRDYFMVQARQRGYEVIDMQEVFQKDYSSRKERFEFPNDGHWNALAHSLVAKKIKDSNVYKSLFSEAGVLH